MSRSRTDRPSEAAVLMAEAFTMAARSAVARAAAAGVAAVGENPKHARVEPERTPPVQSAAHAPKVLEPAAVKVVRAPAPRPAGKSAPAPKPAARKTTLPVKPAPKKVAAAKHALPKASPAKAPLAKAPLVKPAPRRAGAKLVRK